MAIWLAHYIIRLLVAIREPEQTLSPVWFRFSRFGDLAIRPIIREDRLSYLSHLGDTCAREKCDRGEPGGAS